MTIGHHHIYFPRLHISLAWRKVLLRLAGIGLYALVAGIAKGGVPQTLNGAALILAGALVAVLLAAPDAFQAAGILRATAPDTVPLVQGLAQAFAGGIQAALAAPAAKRQAAFEQAVKAGVQDEMRVYGPALIDLAVEKANKTNMEGFAPAELGQKEPDGPNAAPEAIDAPAPAQGAQIGIPVVAAGGSSSGPANVQVIDPAIAATGPTDAIELTGGNQ